MNKKVLVTQSFGRENEYRRALFTIMSYLFYCGPDAPVVLFSDRPDWFHTYLSQAQVRYVQLTPEKISVMRGKIDFLHRMKIALIEEAFSLYPDYHLVYADSDTFFTGNPSSVVEQVTADTASMHLQEHSFESMKDNALPAGKTFRAFYELIRARTFQGADGRSIIVTPEMYSWNAGVMIFHPTHKRFIPDVYALTDQFYPPTENHASEQYAFSVLLQTNTHLIPCESINYHYWYRVKKQIADLFLEKRINEDFAKLSTEQQLGLVSQWVKTLPTIFEHHLLTLQDNAIQHFHNGEYREGYRWAFRALRNKFMDIAFWRNVLYFTKIRYLRSGS